MFAAGIAMLRRRAVAGDPNVHINAKIAAKLTALGLAAGFVSGFFGIGGGFLIVPGIMLGSGLPILNAIGCSLFSVGAFSLTTAINYAAAGLVDWTMALEFIVGGALGGLHRHEERGQTQRTQASAQLRLRRSPVHRRGVHAGADGNGAPRRELTPARQARLPRSRAWTRPPTP